MLAAFALSTILTTQQTDCLFVLTHAGETTELLCVIEELQRQNRDYRVLAQGVAKDLVKGCVPQERLIEEPIQAKKIVTGVHSEVHKYYLDLYRGHAQTFAYWDNPEPRGPSPYFTRALKVQRAADKVLFPSGYVALAPEFQDRPEDEKLVVGKPTLLKFLNLPKKEATKILFVGSYGDGYEKALALFAKTMQTQPQAKSVVFQKHPMSKGNLEENYASALGAIVSSLPIHEAVAEAKVVLTYNSSGGFQALLSGKPVIYVVPENDTYTNCFIEEERAAKASTPAELLDALFHPKISLHNFLDSMQIPTNPLDRFLQVLECDD
jgi:hypothetical protein